MNKGKCRVICLENGYLFDSIAEASRMTGISTSMIQCSMNKKWAARGFHFVRVDSGRDRRYPVRCLETGKEYPSCADASLDCFVNYAGVLDAVKTGKPICGLHFERVD